jgi:hypothetical protein
MTHLQNIWRHNRSHEKSLSSTSGQTEFIAKYVFKKSTTLYSVHRTNNVEEGITLDTCVEQIFYWIAQMIVILCKGKVVRCSPDVN